MILDPENTQIEEILKMLALYQSPVFSETPDFVGACIHDLNARIVDLPEGRFWLVRPCRVRVSGFRSFKFKFRLVSFRGCKVLGMSGLRFQAGE